MESNGLGSPRNAISQQNEQSMESILAIRVRQYRSVSTESVKSMRSNPGSENADDLPDIVEERDEPFVEDLEVHSTVSDAYRDQLAMMIISKPRQEDIHMDEVISHGIASFNEPDSFHGHAKIRRAGSPRVRKTIQTQKKNRDKVKKRRSTPPADSGVSTSSQQPNEPAFNLPGPSFRKRSWARIVDHTED